MVSGPRLVRGKPSKTLLQNTHDYYQGIGVDPGFAAVTWHEWTDYPDVVIFKVMKHGKNDKHHS
jgi:hypothetical protein